MPQVAAMEVYSELPITVGGTRRTLFGKRVVAEVSGTIKAEELAPGCTGVIFVFNSPAAAAKAFPGVALQTLVTTSEVHNRTKELEQSIAASGGVPSAP